MGETDERVYQRYLAGEEDALRVLLERHREGLTLFLLSYVRNMEDAEELMLDAFAVAASGTARFSGRSSFKTWLYGIGKNLAGKQIRKQHLHFHALSDAADPSEKEMPELAVLKGERDRQLYEAIRRLPEDYRRVIYLLELEGMSAEEAARVLGKTRRQIYNLSYRGKMALKEALKGMGPEDAYH